MKVLGRLILLGVGIALLAIHIPQIIQLVNSTDWSTFDQLAEKGQIIANIFVHGVSCFTALIAFVCALIGKATFSLGLIALIYLGIVIWNLVVQIQNGAFNTFDWQLVLNTAANFGLPILYFLGTLFVSLGHER